MKSRFFVGSVLFFFGCFATLAGDFGIQSSSRMGEIVWSGAYTAGVCTVETAPTPGGPWATRQNLFTSNDLGQARVPLSPSNTFCRLLSVDISTNTPRHYTNLLQSYGIL